MRVYADVPQIAWGAVSTTDAEGNAVTCEGVTIPLTIPTEDIEAWLAAFNEASSTSPSAADSRVIARAVLTALKARTSP